MRIAKEMKSKTSIIEFEHLGGEMQSKYYEKARYLQDRGYLSDKLDFYKIAERIYYSELKEKMMNGKNSSSS